LKLLEGNIRKILQNIGIGNDFLNRIPIAQETRTRIHEWDYIKLRSFCSAEVPITRVNRQPTEWEKIFPSYLSDRGLIFIYKELKK
jgi:hypothetical protein